MKEIVFEVSQDADGGYTAECLTEGVFTQADTWDEFRHNVREATAAQFFDRTVQPLIRLHLERNELLIPA